ncbi:MAG: tRNA lysidine(34) synthetase TilS [Woeseia sp.]|nr:tRNA lysidine(34) synthetase TilS [Woeseia sp.]
MKFNSGILSKHLKALESETRQPSRYVVALSGGLDSVVLLHALKSHLIQYKSKIPLIAIHINHCLQPESQSWVEECEAITKKLDIAFKSINVDVDLDSGKGLEASARSARYSALLREIQHKDWLITAHHQEDQAETLLINLFRGSGLPGISGISKIRKFGLGWIVRPILNIPKDSLVRYAKENFLDWIEDPSNINLDFDRNFLRHEVVTRIKTRWPKVSDCLHRSAEHAGEASQLLFELAEIDLKKICSDSSKIPINKLLTLSPARQRNLIRFALQKQKLNMPSTKQLRLIFSDIIFAREDAQPFIRWNGVIIRRYRNNLYLMPDKEISELYPLPISGNELSLGPGMGRLNFEIIENTGLSKELFDKGLTIRRRTGGEKIILYNQSHKRELKKLLQEKGIVPWMRNQLPLVYSGENLVAVGDLWISRDAVSEPGIKVRWIDRPELH